MDLDEFTDLALQSPHVRGSDAMSIIARRFMTKVKKRFSIPSSQGERISHGVLRCDAQGVEDGLPINVTATWLCFPYLSKGGNDNEHISAKAARGCSPSKTLFQSLYEDRSNLACDEIQTFKKETKELLYVHQVWILLLGEGNARPNEL